MSQVPQGTDTRVRLQRNDGSETFRLKTTRAESEISNGLITDSIVSGLSRAVVGGKFVLDLRKYEFDIEIQGMEPEDYPNSSTYSDDDYGFRRELERAALTWGWDFSNGFDSLLYDGQTIQGVLTNYNFTEDTSGSPARTYGATVEWTYLDAFVS